MSSTEGSTVPKLQQPSDDEILDVDDNDIPPSALSAMDSAPDIDVRASRHLRTSQEVNELLDHRHRFRRWWL